MSNPSDRSYTKDHEWALISGNSARVGITMFAQDALGDIVYVKLPEVGQEVGVGESIAEVESTKSVSDIYSPLTGKITAVNDSLDQAPELINSSPYEDGWIFEIAFEGDGGADTISAEEYEELTRG
ncbi:MAG: glycine cleavage system protein GcvH [Actinomycetota bacterium]|nr:glycine cleavage system protein GcvH [Actinomycetota bacterium]